MSVTMRFVILTGGLCLVGLSMAIAQTRLQTMVDHAKTLQTSGEFQQAIAQYRAALRSNPDFAPALDGLAWLRATAKDAQFRDPKEAISLAARAVNVTHYRNRKSRTGEKWSRAFRIQNLYTLTVAYASAGNFEQGVLHAQLAMETARQYQTVSNTANAREMVTSVQRAVDMFRNADATRTTEALSQRRLRLRRRRRTNGRPGTASSRPYAAPDDERAAAVTGKQVVYASRCDREFVLRTGRSAGRPPMSGACTTNCDPS